ncbi:MAG: hypothetical protein ACAI38_00075 [Myxococcota bacterium]|nr:hypothetical protein [Myxococcota bacterium]
MADDSGSPPVDVRLEALMGAVEDVREQMQESLAEVRQLVEQSREAVFRMENLMATSDPSASLRVAERVDGVHAIAERTRKRQGLLMGVVIAQAVMLLVAIVVVLLMRADVREVAAGQPAVAEQDRTLTSAVDPQLQGENESPTNDGIKRRRLSRRHR